MKFLSLVGNSFGCSASGERLVSAAREGDIQEIKALLEHNPRLAKYLTFGVRNSPLHYSASRGHHEIVSLLLESGVNADLRNYRGQTPLMQACQHGHWEVVQTLVLFNANIHRADDLNGGTALHLAALNGYSRCIRLILADYIPSIPNWFTILRKRSRNKKCTSDFDEGALSEVLNRPADGGITALHMAALNGHAESVHLLLDLGASVSVVTVDDGTTIDLIGAGSTPLHYAACGGSEQCCQILIARGASLTAVNSKGWTPLMIARSWQRDWLEEILTVHQERQLQLLPSPYLCIPLKSIVKIARECGWRSSDSLSPCDDPCVVCLERKCTVAAEGCSHEFCTRCALYLCSTNSTSVVAHGPPGSISCPLCRHGIVSFVKLPDTRPLPKAVPSFCNQTTERLQATILETPFCKPDSSFRSLSYRKFPSSKLLNSGLCMGAPETCPSVVPRTTDRNSRNHVVRCSGSSLRRSRSWLCSLN